jgi:hypothetical protein
LELGIGVSFGADSVKMTFINFALDIDSPLNVQIRKYSVPRVFFVALQLKNTFWAFYCFMTWSCKQSIQINGLVCWGYTKILSCRGAV